MPDTPTVPSRYADAPIVGFLGISTALALAYLAWEAFFPTHGNDWGWAYVLVLLGIACALLGLVWLISLIFTLRKHGWSGISPAQRLCAFSPLLSLGAICAISLLDDYRKARHEKNYPGMSETHVNLSDKLIRIGWYDSDLSCKNGSRNYLDNKKFPVAAECARYDRQDAQEKSSANLYRYLYFRGKIRPEAQEFIREEYENASDAENFKPGLPKSYPLQKTGIWPTFAGLPPYRSGSFAQETAGSVQLIYYHYNDRVDVAPAIAMSGLETMALEGRMANLYRAEVYNYTQTPIARIEIEAQALDIDGFDGMLQTTDRHDCRAYAGYLQLPEKPRLRLRWQTAQAPYAWQHAEVEFPAFPRPEIPAQARSEQSLVLRLIPGKTARVAPTWIAQRLLTGQTRMLPAGWAYVPINRPMQNDLLLQATKLPPELRSYPCTRLDEKFVLDRLQLIE